MDDIADRIVESLTPGEDWWRSDAPDTLKSSALVMLKHGMDEDEVESILDQVIGAMRSEYGE